GRCIASRFHVRSMPAPARMPPATSNAPRLHFVCVIVTACFLEMGAIGRVHQTATVPHGIPTRHGRQSVVSMGGKSVQESCGARTEGDRRWNQRFFSWLMNTVALVATRFLPNLFAS